MKISKIVLTLFLSLLQKVVSIVYGQRDEDGIYPMVGMLMACETDQSCEFWCSGTLVGPNVFLTGAHCLEEGYTFKVTFDYEVPEDPDTEELILTGLKQLYDCVFWETDPRYNPNGGSAETSATTTYDYAVVLLDKKPPKKIPRATIALPGYLDSLKDNQELKTTPFKAVGYGGVRTSQRGAFDAYTYLNPYPRFFASQTGTRVNEGSFLLDMHINRDNGGTCFGDSGGPHFVDDADWPYMIVSITSTGDQPCKATDMTTRVDTENAHEFLSNYLDNL